MPQCFELQPVLDNLGNPLSTMSLLPSVHTIDQCTGWVLQSPAEYTATLNLQQLFVTYFSFDPVLFGQVSSFLLITFITGHVTGKIVAWIGK